MKRLIRAIARPLRLRLIDWKMRHSASEIERLCDMRDGLIQLQQVEQINQVKLEMRRQQILRGLA